MRYLFLKCLTIVFIVYFGFANVYAGEDYFRGLDLNGDGKVSHSEFASSLTSNYFDLADVDGDGYLTREEVKKISGLLKEGTLELNFNEVDKNQDGT